MAKKTKRYNDGGDIVVTGRRSSPEISTFDLSRIGGTGGLGSGMGSGVGAGGGGGGYGGTSSGAKSRTQLPFGKTAGYVGPTIRGDNYKVSAGVGPRGSVGIGGKIGFKSGGKADGEPTGGKKHTKAKKYAAGGSTASKRADGCAIKGKTKGRMV